MTFFVKMIAKMGFSLLYCPLNSLKAVILFCFPKKCQISNYFYDLFIIKCCKSTTYISMYTLASFILSIFSKPANAGQYFLLLIYLPDYQHFRSYTPKFHRLHHPVHCEI
jgi:hypothetical protein